MSVILKNLFKIFLTLNILVLDVYFGSLIYNQYFKVGTNVGSETAETRDLASGANKETVCGEGCKKYIDEQISQTLQVSPIVTPTPSNVTQTVVSKKTRKVNYIPIPGSGTTRETVWTSLPGTDFYMTKSDYQGLVAVYFEGNIKLVNGNGVSYVRLYDATHSVAVPGSELSTSSQQSTFVTTGPVTLWEGYNNYQIQARSLTADTTVFESGRLKIITEE